MLVACLAMRFLALNYEYISQYEDENTERTSWLFKFTHLLKMIFPNKGGKLEYDLTEVLIMCFPIAFCALKPAPAEKKTYDYWSDAERLKARGLTEAKHGWGVKPEAYSSDDEGKGDKAAKKDKAEAKKEDKRPEKKKDKAKAKAEPKKEDKRPE